MDPVHLLSDLLHMVSYLSNASVNVEHNGEECRRLEAHANTVLQKIQDGINDDVSPSLLSSLQQLDRQAVD
jgi:hypothetical protein